MKGVRQSCEERSGERPPESQLWEDEEIVVRRAQRKEVVMRDRKRHGDGVRQSLEWGAGEREDLIVMRGEGRQQQNEEETDDVAGLLQREIRKKKLT